LNSSCSHLSPTTTTTTTAATIKFRRNKKERTYKKVFCAVNIISGVD